MTDDRIRLRTATRHDLDAITECFASSFLFDHHSDNSEAMLPVFEPERWIVAEDGDRVVGTAAVLTRDLTVPGAVIPAAHVTGVSVRPADRRRGTLSRMMQRQLTGLPEPVAVLWASQSGLYRRYGYRDASDNVTYEADLRLLGLPDAPDEGRIREITAEQAAQRLPDLFERYAAGRPGTSSRPGAWWTRRLHDPERQRGGASARRVIVHETPDGDVDGYAMWRVRIEWGETGPAHEILVEELVAPDTGAYLALWRFFTGLDMAGRLVFRRAAALDERLRHLVAEPRQLRARIVDGVWVRLVDVPAALEARAYSRDVDLVVEVTDRIVAGNNGRFRLRTVDGKASCAATADSPDLSCEVDVLAGIYLGGRSLAAYAALGEVAEHTPGAVTAAAAAFSWPVAPVSIEVF